MTNTLLTAGEVKFHTASGSGRDTIMLTHCIERDNPASVTLHFDGTLPPPEIETPIRSEPAAADQVTLKAAAPSAMDLQAQRIARAVVLNDFAGYLEARGINVFSIDAIEYQHLGDEFNRLRNG